MKYSRIFGLSKQIQPAFTVHLFKVNKKHTRKMCEICSKLTIKTSERCQWRYSVSSIVNFEQISHFVLVFLLLILNKEMVAGELLHMHVKIWNRSFFRGFTGRKILEHLTVLTVIFTFLIELQKVVPLAWS